MIRYDDLLAARFIHHQRPELRLELARQLQVLNAAPSQTRIRTLLGDLLRSGHLGREQAEYVDAAVERFKRGRSLGIYALLLTRHGVPREVVEGALRSLGDRGDVLTLGAALVESSQLEAEAEARLRFQAKVAFDHDQARSLERYQGRNQAERAQTWVGGAPADSGGAASGSATGMGAPSSDEAADDAEARTLEMTLDATLDPPTGESAIPSGVFRMELVIPSEAEATGIIDRATLGLAPLRAKLAPRFPIPDWIDTTDPMVGEEVGSYRILGKVGAGAMATVYLADSPGHDGPVALKILPASATQERQERFKREILANGFFSHENAVDVYDAGLTAEGTHYLAMEFFDGTDLEAVLETEGSISLRQALSICHQILQALVTAHGAGIVHRDIKPSNILVSPGGSVAKLMDFGIALISDLGEFRAKVFESDAGGVTGTPEYLSPEQAFRDPVGPPADLYALGMVLYRMVAGRLPFHSQTVSGWISCHIIEDPLPVAEAAPEAQFPPELQQLFDRLFVKDPKQRVQTAAEVLEAVDAIALSLSTGRHSRFFGKVRRGF